MSDTAQLAASPHPEEARSAVSKDKGGFRDVLLAPPDEARPALAHEPKPLNSKARYRLLRKHMGERFPEAIAPLYKGALKRPLARGIDRQIEQHPDAQMSHSAIALFLSFYCIGENYWRAVSAPGAMRINLDGTNAGPVSEQEAARARARLRKIQHQRATTQGT